MELQFNKTINGWVVEFNAPTHFNLHLERKDAGRLDLYHKTSGSNYVRIPYEVNNKIVDVDVPVIMSRDYKILCGSRPSMMIVTFADGTILEADIPSDGGNEEVEKPQGGFGAEFVFYAEGTGGWIPETYEFTAQEGMTWTDWLNSAYYIADEYFHIREEGDTLAAYWSSAGIGMQGYVTDEFGGYIKPSDVIISGYTYMFQY